MQFPDIKSIVTIQDRENDCQKYDYGKVLIIGGSSSMSGAVSLAIQGALRSGVGLVIASVPKVVQPLVAVTAPPAMVEGIDFSVAGDDWFARKAKGCTSIVIGPGMGRESDVQKFIQSIISKAEVPLLIDADGLFALSENIEILKETKAPVILTPHEGEFSRLSGLSREEVHGDRMKAADDWLKTQPENVILVLKGEGTIVAQGKDQRYLNNTGNPGMAKGGSGDVLSGLIGGLQATGNMSPLQQLLLVSIFTDWQET